MADMSQILRERLYLVQHPNNKLKSGNSKKERKPQDLLLPNWGILVKMSISQRAKSSSTQGMDQDINCPDSHIELDMELE
jgi:hypothetical protein